MHEGTENESMAAAALDAADTARQGIAGLMSMASASTEDMVAGIDVTQMPPPPPTLTDAPPILSEETQWRRRRRRQEEATTDDDTRSVVSSQWQPDQADVEMMHSLSMIDSLPVGSLRLAEGTSAFHRGGRRVKRMKVDLAAMSSIPPPGDSDGGDPSRGLFTPLVEMKSDGSELTGSALLCFLSPDTFVGFVELQSDDGQTHVLKLNGNESLIECDRAMCAVQDCCGDKAFLVTAQSAQAASGQPGRRKRSFLARSAGVGDYVAFEGRGIRFVTDFVPGDEQGEQVLKRHFSMLPRAVRREAVLCLGHMTLHWRGLSGSAADAGVYPAADGTLGSSSHAVGIVGGAGLEPTSIASEVRMGDALRGDVGRTIGEVRARAHRVVQRRREEHEGYAGDKSEAGSSGDEQEHEPLRSTETHGLPSAMV